MYMAYLLDYLHKVEALFELGPTGLFLDLDGTLSHIVSAHEEAVISERMEAALAVLARHLTLVCIVTGRSVVQAKGIVGLEELVYVGSHGLEVLEQGEMSIAAEAAPYLDYLMELLVEVRLRCRDTDVDFEEKPASFTVHYRNSASPTVTRGKVLATIEELAGQRVKVVTGKRHINVLPPVNLSKGTAVAALIGSRGLRAALVAGDDVTDIDSFRGAHALSNRAFSSLAIAVLGSESPVGLVGAADYILKDVDEMEEFLVWLAQVERGGRI
jgi:trehalose 6-phosphate phosphatase